MLRQARVIAHKVTPLATSAGQLPCDLRYVFTWYFLSQNGIQMSLGAWALHFQLTILINQTIRACATHFDSRVINQARTNYKITGFIFIGCNCIRFLIDTPLHSLVSNGFLLNASKALSKNG